MAGRFDSAIRESAGHYMHPYFDTWICLVRTKLVRNPDLPQPGQHVGQLLHVAPANLPARVELLLHYKASPMLEKHLIPESRKNTLAFARSFGFLSIGQMLVEKKCYKDVDVLNILGPTDPVKAYVGGHQHRIDWPVSNVHKG